MDITLSWINLIAPALGRDWMRPSFSFAHLIYGLEFSGVFLGIWLRIGWGNWWLSIAPDDNIMFVWVLSCLLDSVKPLLWIYWINIWRLFYSSLYKQAFLSHQGWFESHAGDGLGRIELITRFAPLILSCLAYFYHSYKGCDTFLLQIPFSAEDIVRCFRCLLNGQWNDLSLF